MEEQEIENLILKLEKSPNSFYLQKSLLSFLRVSKIRRSDLVYLYGIKLLNNKSKLGSDIWMIYEQIIFACLDIGDIEKAKIFFFQLKNQFGNSSIRVQVLLGMILEAQGEYDDARLLYTELLSKNPMNQRILKRQISIEKSLGNYIEAIKLLKSYMDIHSIDANSWEELGELYLKTQNYNETSFCYEELILLAPENYHYYTILAEVLYTIGGFDKFKLAKDYYSKSLLLNKDQNLRSLYGLQATLKQLKAFKNAKHNENNKLLEWIADELLNIYRGNDNYKTLISNFIQLDN